jgi:hypothetical protein
VDIQEKVVDHECEILWNIKHYQKFSSLLQNISAISDVITVGYVVKQITPNYVTEIARVITHITEKNTDNVRVTYHRGAFVQPLLQWKKNKYYTT